MGFTRFITYRSILAPFLFIGPVVLFPRVRLLRRPIVLLRPVFMV